MFNVVGAVPGVFDVSLGKYLGIPLATFRRDKNSYVAQTAFGVSKDIAVTEEDEAVLLLPVPIRIGFPISTKLSSKPDEARRL